MSCTLDDAENSDQRISIRVDLTAGPFTPAVAERIVQLVVSELGNLGAEVTAL